jgi:intein-encoded DNA endonuclease-like protein
MPISRKVNLDFFKKWSHNTAYVLGFFAADGYITHNKRGADFFSIQITDLDLLDKIRKVLESNHKIGLREGKGKEKNLYRLQIGSKEMCQDLRRLGYAENKTKSLFVPNVPRKYLADFVRGYFDGDGSVWVGNSHKERINPDPAMLLVFTSCSLDFLSRLKSRLAAVGLLGGSVVKNKRNYYRLSYSTLDALKLYDFMYNSIHLKDDGLFLMRKRIIFERLLKMRS